MSHTRAPTTALMRPAPEPLRQNLLVQQKSLRKMQLYGPTFMLWLYGKHALDTVFLSAAQINAQKHFCTANVQQKAPYQGAFWMHLEDAASDGIEALPGTQSVQRQEGKRAFIADYRLDCGLQPCHSAAPRKTLRQLRGAPAGGLGVLGEIGWSPGMMRG